jgi:hypothetical protein
MKAIVLATAYRAAASGCPGSQLTINAVGGGTVIVSADPYSRHRLDRSTLTSMPPPPQAPRCLRSCASRFRSASPSRLSLDCGGAGSVAGA